MTPAPYRQDLLTIVFSMLFIIVMMVACFWVIQPFILSFTWATMVVIATWPVLKKLQKILWGKRILAVLVMTLLLALLFILPISLLINSIVDNRDPILNWAKQPEQIPIPDLLWLKSIPLIGKRMYASYHSLISNGGSALLATLKPYLGQTAAWVVAQAANIGRFFLHCTLMLLFSILLYARGEQLGTGIRHFAIRLGAQRADAAVLLAGQAIRAVALGVVVTALVQSVLGGIGLAVSGIPAATLLTILMFICCVAQLGPLLILIPAVIWLYWSGDTAWGTFLLIWSFIVGTLDGFLRPILIRMGAELPMILILSGVIGGLLTFGMIGLFIGPVVLAVSYRLLRAWIDEAPKPDTNIE